MDQERKEKQLRILNWIILVSSLISAISSFIVLWVTYHAK